MNSRQKHTDGTISSTSVTKIATLIRVTLPASQVGMEDPAGWVDHEPQPHEYMINYSFAWGGFNAE